MISMSAFEWGKRRVRRLCWVFSLALVISHQTSLLLDTFLFAKTAAESNGMSVTLIQGVLTLRGMLSVGFLVSDCGRMGRNCVRKVVVDKSILVGEPRRGTIALAMPLRLW
jgi:hypothetical protein